mgnify:CR=1 FL=1
MMTGIPVNRVAQSESNKLVTMAKDLEQMIIGQDEVIEQIFAAIFTRGHGNIGSNPINIALKKARIAPNWPRRQAKTA